MEQLINSVSPELATFIKERQPVNVNEAARLAEIYGEARRGVKKGALGMDFLDLGMVVRVVQVVPRVGPAVLELLQGFLRGSQKFRRVVGVREPAVLPVRQHCASA